MTVKEKIKYLLAFLDQKRDQHYYLAGENYETVKDIRKMIIKLFPKESVL